MMILLALSLLLAASMHRSWENYISSRKVKIWRLNFSLATLAVAALIVVAEILLDSSGGFLLSSLVNAAAIMLTSIRTPTAAKPSLLTKAGFHFTPHQVKMGIAVAVGEVLLDLFLGGLIQLAVNGTALTIASMYSGKKPEAQKPGAVA